MRRPRVITFDCYGTLIDWVTGYRAYLLDVLTAKGQPADTLDAFADAWYYGHALPMIQGPFMLYREVLQRSLQDALAELGVPVGPEDGADFGTAMSTWEPFEEVPGVLAALAERYTLVAISNSQHDIIEHAVVKLGNPFTHVVCGEDVQAYKPDRRMFERALELTGATPSEVLHVAQSQYVDLPRSVPMGIETIWINRHSQQLNESVPSPALELPDMRQLPALLGCDQPVTADDTARA